MSVRRWAQAVAPLSIFAIVTAWASVPTEPVTVTVGEARVMTVERRLDRVAIADPTVADYVLVGPGELYVVGKQAGTTNLVLWQGQQPPRAMSIRVDLNVEPLRQSILQLLPQEQDIRIAATGNTVIVSGSVSDIVVADTVDRLAKAFAKGSGKSSEGADDRLINLLRIRSPQQVMLQVRIAEVSKSLIDRLGVEWVQRTGGTTGSLLSGFVADATVSALFGDVVTTASSNELRLEAERQNSLIKILAEPTIVAMSGQEGSFLVGGKVYIPVAQGLGSTSIEERSYGVGIRFVPTVLDGGRIILKVTPEVSEPIAREVSAGSDTPLPAFKTSTVSTTVEMREGQNLVIGGLLRDNFTESIRAFPILGEIPLLGALFRRSEMIADRSELLVVVRPLFVKGTDAAPVLPTDGFVAPSRGELLMGGSLEGVEPKP